MPKPKPSHPVHSKRDETESDEESIYSDLDEEDEEEEEEEEEFDLVKRMNEMDIPLRRKTYALKGLMKKYREMRTKMLQEIADAEIAFMADTEKLRVEREKIISGQREVTEEEMKQYQEVTKESCVEVIESDEEEEPATKKNSKKDVKIVTKDDETAKNDLQDAASRPDGGIPRFWLTAMENNDVLGTRISDRDSEALAFLTNVTKEYLDGNPRKGFKLMFYFAENKFFTNKVLEKTYIFDTDEKANDSDDPMLESIEGCTIDWTNSAMNLTVILKKKKQRHKDKNTIRVVEREEPCESFFNFFTAPKKPDEEGSDEEEEEDMDYEQQMEMDYEAGIAFSDLLIPRAVHYYCGKAIEEIASGILSGLDDDDDDDDEEDDEEDEEEEVVPKRGRGGKGGPKGKAGGQEECKQQ